MRRIQLSNRIFDLGLSNAALCVYSYLCSLQGNRMRNGKTSVKVKQKTIAAACGIRSVQTVAKALAELMIGSLIEQSIRTVRSDRMLSTNIYIIKKLPVNDSFFFVNTDLAFSGQLCPRQLVVYLFLCKAHSVPLGHSWNSYNDMAKQIGMKRETVIATVQELVSMKLVYKQLRRSKENNRVFVDNHYFIVRRELGTIKKKELRFQLNSLLQITENCNYPVSTVYHICRPLSSPFCSRGSPQNEIRMLDPKISSFRKRKNKAILTVYRKILVMPDSENLHT